MKYLQNILWLLAAFVAANAIILKAAEPLEVNVLCNKENLNFCGSSEQREFTVTIDIGEMTSKDSLYGYNFQIKYDTNAISLTDLLTYGTLSENCDFKQGGIFEPGYFKAAAVNMGTSMMTGNLPLVAIRGIVKDGCLANIEKTAIEFDYMEFTNEFVHKDLNLNKLEIGLKKTNNGNTVKGRFSDKDVDLNEKIYLNLYMELPDEKITSLRMQVDFSNIDADLDFESMVASRDDVVKDFENDGKKWNFTIENADGLLRGDLVTIELKTPDKYFDEAEIYSRIIEDENTCLCVNEYKPDTCRLRYENPEVGLAVSEMNADKSATYFVENNVFHNKDNFDKIFVYSCMGDLTGEVDAGGQPDVEFLNCPSGIYFCKAARNKQINNIIIIKI